MSPVKFDECNVSMGSGQPEYNTLPAYKAPNGTVMVCWKLTWAERLSVLLSGKVWHLTLTFHKPFQPVLLLVDKPEATLL